MAISSEFSHEKLVIFHSFLLTFTRGSLVHLLHPWKNQSTSLRGQLVVKIQVVCWLPSGKFNKKLWKDPPFLMGQSTIVYGHFQ